MHVRLYKTFIYFTDNYNYFNNFTQLFSAFLFQKIYLYCTGCSCGGGSTTPGLNCPGGSATLPLIKIIAPIPTPVPTPATTPAPVISSTTSPPTAPSKHDNLFFDYDLLKYNPVVIRM